MVDLLSETEGTPASYPAAPSGLSTAAAAIEPAVVWRRIEDWIRARWGERAVTWIIEGAGPWSPRMTPATITATEVWRDESWQSVTLTPDPQGYLLSGETYRVTATVGSTDTPPPTILEAYKRLAEYLAAVGADAALGHTGGRDGDFSYERPAAWAARAMHYSGAGDLLRAYR